MTYYEGRKGDFFLTEFRPLANGQTLKIASATDSYSKNAFGANPATAAMAIDGDPQTGWGAADRPAHRHVAVFQLAEPTDINELDLEMTFGRHFASSLGKFRLSLTTATQPTALDIDPAIDAAAEARRRFMNDPLRKFGVNILAALGGAAAFLLTNAGLRLAGL